MIANRSVRANRGARLKEIIAKGFDSSDEEVLKAASSDDEDVWAPSSTSSSSGSSSSNSEGSSSSSSSVDDNDSDVDSDFSAEEVDGKLSDATSESDAERQASRVMRKEAAEEKRKKQHAVGSQQRASKSSTLPQHRVTLRRSTPTIPHAQRMAEALERARISAEGGEGSDVLQASAAATTCAGVNQLIASLSTRRKRRRPQSGSGGPLHPAAFSTSTGGDVTDHLDEVTTGSSIRRPPPQRRGEAILQQAAARDDCPVATMYSSSKALLDTYGSPVVISFHSATLPTMFSCRVE